MEDLISTEYRDLLQLKHTDKPWGGAGKSWVSTILPLLNRFPPGKIKVLDFGCGRGTLKPALEELHLDVEVLEYDPGVPGKDVLSMIPVDYVVCTDVMEHVEEDKVEATLKVINFLAKDGVFFNIDLCLSKSFLPDGRNTHITLKPIGWWMTQLEATFPYMKWELIRAARCQLVVHGYRNFDE